MRRRGRPRHPDVLTPREWEVLALLREDHTNPEIAEKLGIGREAVKSHVSSILNKLGVNSREEAAQWRPEAAGQPPRQVVVFAPFAYFWRRLSGSAVLVAGAGAALAAVGGAVFFAVLLARTGGHAGLELSSELPITVSGDRIGVSSLNGSAPISITTPGAYTSVMVNRDGVLRYFQRTGAAGFYEVRDNVPALVIPVQPVSGVYAGEWSPDGSLAAWIAPQAETSVLWIAEPDGSSRAVGPEGLANFIWSPDSAKLLAWPNGGQASTYLIDVKTGDAKDVGLLSPVAWSTEGDFIVRDPAEPPSGNLVAMHEDGSRGPLLGAQYIPYEGGNTKVTFSPDGHWVAWDAGVDGDGSALYVASAVDATTKVIPTCAPEPCAQPGAQPAWSPDGSRLAWEQDGRVYIATTGVWEGYAVADGGQPIWSPDGLRIAYVRGAGTTTQTLYTKRADGTGSEISVVDAQDTRPFWFQTAWWPDGSRLAVTIQAPDVQRALVLELKTGAVEDLPNLSPGPGPLLAPDGSAFAFAAGNAMTLTKPDGSSHTIGDVGSSIIASWSQDARFILLVGGGLRLLDLTTERSEELVQGNVQDAVMSPDDKRVAFIRDQRLNVLDLATGNTRELAPQLAAIYSTSVLSSGNLAWSPDGKDIAVGDWHLVEPITQGQSDLYVVDVESGIARRLTDAPRAKRAFAWSPDGKFIAYVTSLDSGDHLRAIEVTSGKQTALDAISYSSSYGAAQWASDDELVLNGEAGLSFESVNGSSKLIVQGTTPCSYSLFGLATRRLYFSMRCSHSGL